MLFGNWILKSQIIHLFFILCSQCHNAHFEAPSAEERCSGAMEASVCVGAGCRLSELFTGLARGPLLPVHQVSETGASLAPKEGSVV